jgi:antitoxin component YwqK of YwqJK toxin-antitoxin module
MFLALTPLAISLAGCGSEKVDSRDIEFNDGLAYQVNHQDPFTGIVTYIHGTPDIVGKLYAAASWSGHEGNVDWNISRGFTCSFHYKDGLMEGDAECKDDGGNKVASFSIKKGLFDGAADLYSPFDSKKKYANLNWKDGTLDGDQELYGQDGATVIDEFNVSGGKKDGREVVRDGSGNVLADGKWSNGVPESGSLVTIAGGKIASITTYSGGLKQGKATHYSNWPGGPYVSTGEFDKDQRVGPWDDVAETKSAVENDIDLGHIPVLAQFPLYNGDDTAFKFCSSYKSTWSQGHLAGKVECFDIRRQPVLEFEIENGQLVGDITYHTPNTGEIVTIHQQGGRVVGQASSGAEPPSTVQPVSAASTTSGGDECVNKWIDAFRKEQGADAPISNDQLSEWQDDCQQGKQAP